MKSRPLHRSCGNTHVARSSEVEHLAVDQGMGVQFSSGNPRRYIGPREAAEGSICVGGSMAGRQAVNLMVRKGRRGFDSLPAHWKFFPGNGVETGS